MGNKYVIAAFLLTAATFGGAILACLSKRVRDVFFFLLVTLSAPTERLDVNFMSREWYRGTTCGFEVSLVDVLAISLLIGCFLFPRAGYKRWYWPASFLLMVVYFLFSAFCVAVADPKLFGLFALSKLVRGMIVFLAAALYIRSERELRLFVVALATIVCVQALLGIEQRYRFGIHRVFASLNDANSLSMYFCTTTPVFVAAITSQFPKYVKYLSASAIALACVGLVLTLSRAGTATMALVLTGATLATITYKFTFKKVGIALVVIAGVAGIIAKSWETLGSRFKESTLTEEYGHVRAQTRGHYIELAVMIAKERPFGVGPNNWSYWVSDEYGPRLGFHFAPHRGTDKPPKENLRPNANVDNPQAAPAHSLGALTLGEMGAGGLLLLLVLWFRWFQMGASFLWPRISDPMRRMGVGIFFGTWGIFLQSITEWVFHQTAIFFTFNIMLGALASLNYLRKQARKAAKAARQQEEDAWYAPPVQISPF